jgi:SAM-dependent methyltransferase/uncharacterized protein YbaR (Trm112 family)
MRKSLLEVLADPVSKHPLELEEREAGPGGETVEGALVGPRGSRYPVTGGIPRFVLTDDAGQRQTEGSFGFKWRQRDSYENEGFLRTYREWLVAKYGFGSAEEMRRYFGARRWVMDAGCGAGMGASVWLDETWRGAGRGEWVGVDISEAADVARDRLGAIPGTNFVQADVLQLPFREGSFDIIFSEGVLHHTPSTERAFKSLVPLLAEGGEVMFYVYRKKSPVREFTDDYIRGLVSEMPPERAWELMRPLTRLAQALSELRAEVEVPEDVPFLEIKAGRYDVQRLIYWHFAKLFWSEGFGFEGSHNVNFDWYHPRYAHRQTEEEVRRWCGEAGLSVTHFDAQESGYTVRAVRG